ncbi:hypothetical protein N9P96_00005, partial [bacterium]|nr:hypothetical protein [bacterium]
VFPGLLYIVWGNYVMTDQEFIKFIKIKAVFLICVPLIGLGFSQAMTYFWSVKNKIRKLFFNIIVTETLLGAILFCLLLIVVDLSIWFDEISHIEIFLIVAAQHSNIAINISHFDANPKTTLLKI